MCIFVGLAVHEAAHLFCAVLFNIKFHKFKITFLGFNVRADLENVNSVKKIILFIAGPSVNLLLYYIFIHTPYAKFAHVNIFLFMINLIPIVPLDGGNICKTILETFLDINSVCRYMIMTNTFFIVCFMVIIYIYKNYIYFLLVLMALLGILEENKDFTVKKIKRNYMVLKRNKNLRNK